MKNEELAKELRIKKLSGVPSVDKPWLKYYVKNETDIEVPEMSLTDYIYSKNYDRLDFIALNYLGKKINYEQLFDKIYQTGKRFQKYGVKEKDYVALAMPLTPEVIYMIYGLDNIGANANLIDPRVPEERMQFYLDLVETKLAAIISPYISTMRNACKESTINKIIDVTPLDFLDSKEKKVALRKLYNKQQIMKLLYGNIRDEVINNLYNFKSKLFGGSKIISYSDFEKTKVSILNSSFPYEKDKTSVLEYTSGTTGVPKCLGLTASGMNVTAEQLAVINDAKPGETILAIMPPFISYGAVTGIHNSLGCGFEMILVPNFSVDFFAELIKKYKPNNIICVPSMFSSVIKSHLFDGQDVSYIKRLIFGGDKTLPSFEEEVNKWLKNHNCSTTLIKGGGMAEYSSCAFETPFESTKKAGIYGIPLPLVDVKIMKDDYTECGYYEIGEIYISSPQQMKGYINNSFETEKFFFIDENGKKWGRSGDLGFIDTDGAITLTSRKKQMIVRPDGHNVFPNEIEETIMKSGFVKSCVVIGVKDSESVIGEYPFAFIELKDDYVSLKDSILEAIKKKVSSEIPVRDRPKDTDYFLMKMEYTKEGKLDRDAILKKLKK